MMIHQSVECIKPIFSIIFHVVYETAWIQLTHFSCIKQIPYELSLEYPIFTET